MQSILDTVAAITCDVADNQQLVKQMRQDFVKRDYLAVFMQDRERLYQYLQHWVPSRAIAYYSLFQQSLTLQSLITGRFQVLERELKRRRAKRAGLLFDDSLSLANVVKIICFGAGSGSELLAVSQLIKQQLKAGRCTPGTDCLYSDFEDQLVGVHAETVNLHLVDIADWSWCIDALRPQCPEKFKVSFSQQNVLKQYDTDLNGATLVTFMFVLNELFAESKAQTVTLLQRVLTDMPTGAHLLVVESAGSFSELQVGTREVMLFKLLDGIKQLRVVESKNAEWFRYPQSLKSSVPLDNMRYFMRLYQKR